MRRQRRKNTDQRALILEKETVRLQMLTSCDILDSAPEAGFDAVVKAASYICQTPISLVSLVDQKRQWFKACVGLAITETPRSMSFCSYAIRRPNESFVVTDTHLDGRFAQHPLVVGDPYIRFYAGFPLVTNAGHALGTLCVIDTQPRVLDPEHASILVGLAKQISTMLDQRSEVLTIQQQLKMQADYQVLMTSAVLALELKNEELFATTLTDPLTGIGNRRGFDLSLAKECERVLSEDNPLSLMMIDIDYFKSYNDDFGHVEGDGVLIEIARILRSSVRAPEYLARYGGEEFVIILPSTTEEAADIVAERIRDAVEQHAWVHRSITISIGIATSSNKVELCSLLNLADTALYRAKIGGRNRIKRSS